MKIKITPLLPLLLLGSLFLTPLKNTAQQLRVSENERFLEYDNGKPFFWLGDTAWELFHRLNRQEAAYYLENRAEKGFTVIQAVVLAEFDGLHAPNPYGEIPLIEDDPARPNEAYFKHVDFIVNKAAKLGLFIGMLPTWGDKVVKRWGMGPEVFTPENAYIYGKFLGERYKNDPIIWILGGDRNPDNETHIAIWDAMAKGIREGTGDRQLLTYHPQGGSGSSKWFHKKDWLAFNTFQSGHGARDIQNYKTLIHNYNLSPTKPVLDSEPNYEDHPVGWKPEELGWFDSFDSRRSGYWSMLSGACGHTYGNHNIWQMLDSHREPVSFARTSWRFALDHPGAFQAGFMRRLFETFPWQNLVPDQSAIKGENPDGPAHQVAAVSSEGDVLLAYTPYGKALNIDLSRLKAPDIEARWYNPRDGRYWPVNSFTNDGKTKEFKPHSAGRGSDWVLVLAAGHYFPGQ
ncbi:collagenase-like protein with putative collagen-binding domain [Anseongella ginsenosidimutans]|uniref:Collagenase-like protein with putative collagen-binding domain n=1 Tax=Anseongella ginsenosidimutans TaxID=496056 RepID=A0A4R3KS98_9SPHI|nr:glycoside hydrolase family 140 protein [Anseongella ginsenosidimutans]QEC53217.1 DUF4038 domain-containing protein [Anseongella ginsenosidimutans]TCS87850.1 collagenase-like protein with putative collagen-binding domain [Anseongella ginsenosidimutans]